MTELTLADLGSQLVGACDEYLAELREMAAESWETKPDGGEGEDAWCARQVAEHVQGACGFFGGALAKAADVEGAGRTYTELPSPAAAVEGFPGAVAALQGVVARLNDTQLGIELDAPWGKTNVAGLVRGAGAHFKDHANQLRTLRG